MIETLQQFMQNNTQLLGWMAGISIATFLISILLIPVVISRLPARYFCLDYRQKTNTGNAVKTRVSMLLKNLLGVILVVAGFLMFFIPGQGVLTMLIGLGLMNFPGKYKLERKIVSRAAVLKSINWIRSKAGVENMVHPDEA